MRRWICVDFDLDDFVKFNQFFGVAYSRIDEFKDYEIGSDGSVWSLKFGKRKRLKPSLGSGYETVSLCRNGERHEQFVHQMVLKAFSGPRPAGMVACHTPDPTKTNNNVNNLRWQTPAQNIEDARRDGVLNGRRARKLNAESVKEIRRLKAEGMRTIDVAKRFEVSRDTVRSIHRRQAWKDVE
ncbi:HNH endonuclease [Flavisphingomonas formosensis]|uniref:HNH endonuclease n=1 Tax=Flavisphingomonas formosensis TaxID=861534 RepID=UPI0012F821AD|nr:HNH endonuclease [Sphingomonas formosensis]